MSLKNPCFKYINDILDIKNNYFHTLNIHFFGHVTVFKDGKFYFNTSDIGMPKFGWVDNNIPPMGFTLFDEIKNKACFPAVDSGQDFGWTDEDTKEQCGRFGIEKPMVIFKKHTECYELYFFELKHDNPYEIYLNHFDLFENYINFYQDQASDILSDIQQKPLQVDVKHITAYASRVQHDKTQLNTLRPRAYYLYSGNSRVPLSGREHECLSLLAHGKQVKYAAEYLKISPRTFETYINRIKHKLGVSSLATLIDIFWMNQI